MCGAADSTLSVVRNFPAALKTLKLGGQEMKSKGVRVNLIVPTFIGSALSIMEMKEPADSGVL